ncbi:MAG: hypothetical protein HRU39_12710, partial [Salinicola sp.]|uniref:hypothetical protein n=1 Tax=Salinicola sp. TaxID=1978524 RepID=UPI001DCF5227
GDTDLAERAYREGWCVAHEEFLRRNLTFDPKRLARLETTQHVDRSADQTAVNDTGYLPRWRFACAWGGSGIPE